MKIHDAQLREKALAFKGAGQTAFEMSVAGDDEAAIISLQKAVTLNPRQFAAMAELGAILSEYGDKRDALAVLRKAIALDRHFVGLGPEVQKLTRDVEGERI